MKLNLAIAAITLSASVFSMNASADDGLAQSLCDYVANDVKNDLRVALSDNRLRLRNVYDGVVCNGLPLIRHAIKHDASNTAEFMVKQLPSAFVAQSGDVEWAIANGYEKSPIIAVIKARAAG